MHVDLGYFSQRRINASRRTPLAKHARVTIGMKRWILGPAVWTAALACVQILEGDHWWYIYLSNYLSFEPQNATVKEYKPDELVKHVSTLVNGTCLPTYVCATLNTTG